MRFGRSPERVKTRTNRFLVSAQGVEKDETTAIEWEVLTREPGAEAVKDAFGRIDLKSCGLKT